MTAKQDGQIDVTAKPCGYRQEERKKCYRRLFRCISALISLILLSFLIAWLIFRPSKPKFTIQQLSLSTFNLNLSSSSPSSSSPNSYLYFITANLQITLLSRNPNSRIGIYYDSLQFYATYRNQQITQPSMLPVAYQGHREVTLWSPILSGYDVPVAQDLALGFNQDWMARSALIGIKGNGRVRWKVGDFVSKRYHLNVNCQASINFGGGDQSSSSSSSGNNITYDDDQLFKSSCTVDV